MFANTDDKKSNPECSSAVGEAPGNIIKVRLRLFLLFIIFSGSSFPSSPMYDESVILI